METTATLILKSVVMNHNFKLFSIILFSIKTGLYASHANLLEPVPSLETLTEEPVPLYTADGFPIPQPNTELFFPRSHGSHPEFRIEWWYLTGHLISEAGRRFGYQATFFRTALRADPGETESSFGVDQLYLAHMALTDPERARFFFADRLTREGWDAEADPNGLRVRNGPWSLVGIAEGEAYRMSLEGSVDTEASWSLSLSPLKPLVRFGPDGTSRKGASPDARSYYLSFTRLATTGTIRIGETVFAVEGLSWMDHEIASTQLDATLTGWDWIAIQLKDGWEVKAYLLRQEDGLPSPFSACIWISPSGTTYPIAFPDFVWQTLDSWQSPDSKATYPVHLRIQAPHPETGNLKTFEYVPLQKNQELVLDGSTYWEGAGRVLDKAGQEIGSAYLELVGYAGAIEGLR